MHSHFTVCAQNVCTVACIYVCAVFTFPQSQLWIQKLYWKRTHTRCWKVHLFFCCEASPLRQGAVDTRCGIESTFLREHKVPAVMATSTGVHVCVRVLVCGQHPGELVSCCFRQEITQLNQAAWSGAADAEVEAHTYTLTYPTSPHTHTHTHTRPFTPN